MNGFDIAPDGERVAFWTPDAGGIPRAWAAPLDRRSPPKQLTTFEAQWPSFGPAGDIYILVREGGHRFIAKVGPDGIARQKTTPVPDSIFTAASLWLLRGLGSLLGSMGDGGL